MNTHSDNWKSHTSFCFKKSIEINIICINLPSVSLVGESWALWIGNANQTGSCVRLEESEQRNSIVARSTRAFDVATA